MNKTYLTIGLYAMFSLTPCLAADDFYSLLGARGVNWSPLTAEEIATVHTCNAGSVLLICAGKKRIATGILLIDKLRGQSFDPDIPIYPFPTELIADNTFTASAMVTIKQNVESGGPAWKKTYYVLSDDQLTNIINLARRNLEWKPPEPSY